MPCNSGFLGACGVFRKERGLACGTKIGNIFGDQKHVCESGFSLLDTDNQTRRRSGNMARYIIDVRDAPMHNVEGVLGRPEAVLLRGPIQKSNFCLNLKLHFQRRLAHTESAAGLK